MRILCCHVSSNLFRHMQLKNNAFDDFVDNCLLGDDNLCKYQTKNLDNVVQSLVSIKEEDWQAFEELVA